MAQLVVPDLDPQFLERLKARAARHGRSVPEEARAILEAAVTLSMTEARTRAAYWQQRLAGRAYSNSADLIREDRNR